MCPAKLATVREKGHITNTSRFSRERKNESEGKGRQGQSWRYYYYFFPFCYTCRIPSWKLRGLPTRHGRRLRHSLNATFVYESRAILIPFRVIARAKCRRDFGRLAKIIATPRRVVSTNALDTRFLVFAKSQQH